MPLFYSAQNLPRHRCRENFPLASPNIVNVEIVSRAKVRRARLFYLRERKGRASRLNTRKFVPQDETKQEKPIVTGGALKTGLWE